MADAPQLMIGPYQPQPPACRPHDPRAAQVAQRVAELLHQQRPQLRVDHVGSTAVPGCAGKGIVDLLVAVPAAELPAVRQTLDRLGFQRQTGADPFPEERPMRVGSIEHEGASFQLHVHLVPDDSPEVEQTRFFRACLRADPDLVKAYVACKRKLLAGGVTDPQDYCRRKGEFIRQVLG